MREPVTEHSIIPDSAYDCVHPVTSFALRPWAERCEKRQVHVKSVRFILYGVSVSILFSVL